MSDRPPIPDPVKRAVRQECCFGCVICGAPLFDYDHIEPYTAVQEHEVGNLALLCRTHHSDKTAGRLSQSRVKESRQKPYNMTKDYTAPYRIEPGRDIKMEIGSNSIQARFGADGTFRAIWLNGEDMLTISAESGWFTFSMNLTDTTGKTVFSANRGEIVATTQEYDYRCEGRNIKIWRARRDVIFDADISDCLVHIKKGCFMSPHGDGFIVEDPWLIEVVGGKPVGRNIGGRCGVGPTSGGYGCANKAHFDQTKLIGGFGVMRKIGYE